MTVRRKAHRARAEQWLARAVCGAVFFIGVGARAEAPHVAVPAEFGWEAVVPVKGTFAQDYLVPERVYRGLTDPLRRDLCVFDSAGSRVPFAWVPVPVERLVEESTAPVYRVMAESERTQRLDLLIEKTPNGALVVRESASGGSPSKLSDFVVDLGAERTGTRLEIEWEFPEGERLWEVELATSPDLVEFWADGKRVLGNFDAGHRRTELDASAGGRYLRITTTGGFPPGFFPRSARLIVDRELPREEGVLSVTGMQRETPQCYLFDLPGRFPWTRGQLLLAKNARADGNLLFSPDAKMPDEFFHQGSFTDRDELEVSFGLPWNAKRIQAQFQDRGSATTAKPVLVARYEKQLVRFLPNGPEPHRIAFGSFKASCDGMDSLLDEKTFVRVEGEAEFRELAGGQAITAPVAPRWSRKSVVLASILVAGVALLGVLAWRLLRDLQKSA